MRLMQAGLSCREQKIGVVKVHHSSYIHVHKAFWVSYRLLQRQGLAHHQQQVLCESSTFYEGHVPHAKPYTLLRGANAYTYTEVPNPWRHSAATTFRSVNSMTLYQSQS